MSCIRCSYLANQTAVTLSLATTVVDARRRAVLKRNASLRTFVSTVDQRDCWGINDWGTGSPDWS